MPPTKTLLLALIAAIELLLVLATFPAFTQTHGWVLIAPPIRTDAASPHVHDNAPVPEWNYVSAHDTAKSCEEARKTKLNDFFDTMKLADSGSVTMGADKIRALAVAGVHAQCVPYDLWWGQGK